MPIYCIHSTTPIWAIDFGHHLAQQDTATEGMASVIREAYGNLPSALHIVPVDDLLDWHLEIWWYYHRLDYLSHDQQRLHQLIIARLQSYPAEKIWQIAELSLQYSPNLFALEVLEQFWEDLLTVRQATPQHRSRLKKLFQTMGWQALRQGHRRTAIRALLRGYVGLKL